MLIEDLISNFISWIGDTITKLRTDNGEQGYAFHAHDIGYSSELTTPNIQAYFDRSEQNKAYVDNYNEIDPNKKQAYGWYQSEINMIYSYHKCFAMRNRSRLEYYRCDLSQKGARTKSAINIGLGRFLHLRDITVK